MNIKSILMTGLAVIALTGCDALLAPEGAPAPLPDQPAPPPLDADFEEFSADDPYADPFGDTDNDENADETAHIEANDELSPPPAGTDLENAGKLTDLAAVNAVSCAANAVGDTQTIAQIANAEPPASPLNDSLSSRVIQPSVVNPVGGALALSVLRADFPGIVKMEPRKAISETSFASGHCGATRIATNWFVTAAHCLDEDYDVTLLRVGHEKLDGPVVRDIKASWSACHGAYTGEAAGLGNDIALVRISDEEAVTLNDIPVATMMSNDANISPLTQPIAKMAGWGMTSPGGQLSNTLLGTEVKVTSVGPAMIKVESIDGKGPCIGDSGGPLFLESEFGQPILWGVLSGVEKGADQACSGDYTARYTNLQGYANWVNGVMKACSSNPDLCVAPADAS